MKKVLFLFSVITISFSSCINKPNSKLIDGKAHFEYFKYTGNDAYFNENKLEEGQFYNPVLPGFYPDPSICQKGDDFYLVTSTFSFFPGIPIFHSKDLVHWKLIGHVLDRPSQLNIVDQPVSYGIFAPAISYNPHNEMFYLTTTFVGGGGNFLVTAKNPAGSWSDPIWFSEVDGIDPSLFFDDDGKAYLVNNGDPEGESLYQGHKAVWFQEFDVKTNKLIGPRKVIRNGGHDITQKPIWIEGPHIYKIGEYYYLMTAEGGTSINHSQVIFRSKRVDGPYQPNPDNPILTQRDFPNDRTYPITNTGHADMVQTKNGKWYAVFLGCRPYNEQNYFNIGREVFLHPVKWENDWPEILEKGKVVPRILDLPNLIAKIEGANFKKQGNFSYIDSFKQAELSKEWFFLRTPKEKWYQPDKAGGIYINTRDVNLREFKQPSAIFRRQQHHEMTVETALNFMPTDSTDFAGLVLFQNEAFHLSLGITKINGQNMIVLQKAKKENDSIVRIILEKAKLPNTFDGHIELSATSKKGEFEFSYKLNDGDWVLLKDGISTEYLSTEKAGGFIGTVIGLYASSNEL